MAIWFILLYATRLALLALADLITVMTLGESYKVMSFFISFLLQRDLT
jgi:hypothetical protein